MDGVHGTEKAYLGILLGMAEKDKVLAQHMNIPDLKIKLKNSKNNCYVFEN